MSRQARVAREAEKKAWHAERAESERAWIALQASPEYQAEQAAEAAQHEEECAAIRQRQSEYDAKRTAASKPMQDSGLAMLRRQAAKERADAAKDDELAQRERAVRGREITRREQRQDTFDADAASVEADAPTGETLADFTIAFTEGVDLTPLPAVVERNDGATVLYSGKLNWVFGLPGSGKSWVSLIADRFCGCTGRQCPNHGL